MHLILIITFYDYNNCDLIIIEKKIVFKYIVIIQFVFVLFLRLNNILGDVSNVGNGGLDRLMQV